MFDDVNSNFKVKWISVIPSKESNTWKKENFSIFTKLVDNTLIKIVLKLIDGSSQKFESFF